MQRCFGRLTDAWRAQFPDAVELPRWHDMLLQNVPIFDLDFDAILAAMYALTDSAEGDCYLSVPPDPRIAAAALGASASAASGTGESAAPGTGESALSGTAPTEALHTFTLDSGASRSFFRDSTTLTPLSRPVAVSLADPSGGPVLAHSSTVLPCPAAPSGLLSGLYLPSFSKNLVSGADLQDAWVDQFAPGGQRVTHCTCSRTGRHLATFSRRPGSSLYTLTTAPPPVSTSGMAFRTLVSGLPQCHPPLPPGPAPTCVPCVKGRQHVAPHSSSFPPTEAALQTLHMEVWGPARVRGQGHELLINWIRGNRRQLSERFGSDCPFLRLHSDTGGELYSDLLRAVSHAEGIRQTFMLPASPRQNGIAERRIGMVMDVAETTPTLRWTGKVGDASAFRVWGSRAFVRNTSADKLSSRAIPCVFLGFPPDAPGWQFYNHTLRRVLSSQDVTFDESVSYYRLFPYRAASLPPPPLFLAPGTPPVDPLPPQGPAPSGVSQVDPAKPVEVAVDSGAARGAEPASAGTGGAEHGGAERERVEPGGAVSRGAECGGSLGVPLRREPLSPQRLREWYTRRCRRAAGAGATGVAAGAGVARGAAGPFGGAAGAGAARGAVGAGATGGAAGAGAAKGFAGAGVAGGTTGAGAAGAAGLGGACTGGIGAAGAGDTAGVGVAGTEASGAAGVVAGDPGAEGTGVFSAVSGGTVRPRPYYVPLLQQFLGLPPSPGPPPPILSPQPVQSESQLQPSSPLPGPSPYSGPARGLSERREPESRPVSPVSRAVSPVRTTRAGRCVSCLRPPPVPGTHSMTLRPSTALQRVPLPSPPASSLPDSPDPESDSLRAISPTVPRFLATPVTDPLFDSFAASALVAELVDFAAACRLDFATSLVAESVSESICPPSVGGECALGMDVL
ncbi:unnamed protein product [Closterium sp. NIES-54]